MKPSVLITGASSGIGAAAAAHLLRHGFEVFGTSRRPEAASQQAPGVRFDLIGVNRVNCGEFARKCGVARNHGLAHLVALKQGQLDGCLLELAT